MGLQRQHFHSEKAQLLTALLVWKNGQAVAKLNICLRLGFLSFVLFTNWCPPIILYYFRLNFASVAHEGSRSQLPGGKARSSYLS